MRRNHKQVESLVSVVAYSTCSICMILLNKLVLHAYDLNYHNSLLFLQNGGACLLVMLAKYAGWVTYPGLSMKITRRWLPLTLLFVTMLYTSMKSLHLMSVSAQTIIKNLAIVLTATGDMIVYKKVVTPGMYSSFFLMVLGSYLGARGDPWVTAWGLFWTFANIFATVTYTLYMKRLTSELGQEIGRYGPVFFNNFFSLPFFLIAGCNEFVPLATGIAGGTVGAKLCVLFVTIISSCMTFTVFWCMEMTSPTTFSVVGALNKVPLAFLGILIFKQYPDMVGYAGIVIALSAGFLYAFLNSKASKPKGKEEPEIESTLQTSTAEHRSYGPTLKDLA